MPASTRCARSERRHPAAWLAVLAWLLLTWLAVPARAEGGAVAADLAAEVRAGRAFVAVLIDSDDRRLRASEAYADWQAYLQPFVREGRGALPVFTLKPRQARQQLKALSRRQGNGTLFVNAQGQALLHDGLVLEPQVYLIGRAFAEGGAATPEAASYGLKPLALK